MALLAMSSALLAQSLSAPPGGDNQKARISQWIGPVEVDITYSSPNVHGPQNIDRKGHIWGELVPYGFVDQGFGVKSAPWRAGANENTIITFSHDVKVGGKDLKAGSYGFFIAPEKDAPWTLIFSKNTTSWGSFFYNANEDALRITATPEDAPYTEYLTYGFDSRKPASVVAYLQWENKRIPFTIEVPNVNDLYVALDRDELRGTVGFNFRNFSQAAQFCADHKINLEEALTWADRAMDPIIGGQEDFNTLQTKAAVLNALGRNADATVVMDKAIKLPSASVAAIHQYAKTLLAAGKTDKAMEIFQYNFKTHPEEKFTTYVGLARGYTALGDKKNAIKNWEIAIKNMPENQKRFAKVYEGELQKLKEDKKS